MLRSACLIPLLIVGLVTSASAQAPQGGRGAAGQRVEEIRPLKADLYVITGGGANTLVRVTPEGLIVVDTKSTLRPAAWASAG